MLHELTANSIHRSLGKFTYLQRSHPVQFFIIGPPTALSESGVDDWVIQLNRSVRNSAIALISIYLVPILLTNETRNEHQQYLFLVTIILTRITFGLKKNCDDVPLDVSLVTNTIFQRDFTITSPEGCLLLVICLLQVSPNKPVLRHPHPSLFRDLNHVDAIALWAILSFLTRPKRSRKSTFAVFF